MNSDGLMQTRLTDDPDFDGEPSWSPDGTKIAFYQQGGIYVMNVADGAGQTRLTYHVPGGDLNPSWGISPDLPPSQLSTLTIKSITENGSPFSGMWITIHAMNNTLLKSGYTPLAFESGTGTDYKVTAENYDGITFKRWQDTGQNINSRTVSLKSNMTIAAAYSVPEVMGFTPITFTGAKSMPDLTVNALTADDNGGNRTLNMWTIIHAVKRNSLTEWTYRVYATDGYQNLKFDHWEDGSTDRFRSVTLDNHMAITAYYREG
ncbi:MAG: hypothetical protein C4292_00675 [Nitrososphaera sp.]